MLQLASTCEELVDKYVIDSILRPLQQTIAIK
jgi:hypothetical protein